MIARIWTARASASNAARYREHFEQHVRPTLRTLDGYLDATVMTSSGDETEIVVMTRWHSLEAIRASAGSDVGRAIDVQDEMPSGPSKPCRWRKEREHGSWNQPNRQTFSTGMTHTNCASVSATKQCGSFPEMNTVSPGAKERSPFSDRTVPVPRTMNTSCSHE